MLVHHRSLPSQFVRFPQQFTGTHLYTWVERGIVRVSLDVNFCKDLRDKTEVPDPLAVEDLISYKLNDKRKLAWLIIQYRDIFSNI